MKISMDENGASEMYIEDKFLSAKECATLIAYLATHGSQRVFKNPTETHRYATGSEVSNKTIGRIKTRVSEYLALPESHMENMVLIDYELEEAYKYHNDFEPNKSHDASPIVAQVLMFLQDVESGGGTEFPNLGLSVAPKKGRAVFWYGVQGMKRPDKAHVRAVIPQTLKANPFAVHSPIPVSKGKKIIAIFGFHQHPYLPIKEIIISAGKKNFMVPKGLLPRFKEMTFSDVDLAKSSVTAIEKRNKPLDKITFRHHLKATPDLTLKIIGTRGDSLIYEDARFGSAYRMDTTKGQLLRLCKRCMNDEF